MIKIWNVAGSSDTENVVQIYIQEELYLHIANGSHTYSALRCPNILVAEQKSQKIFSLYLTKRLLTLKKIKNIIKSLISLLE